MIDLNPGKESSSMFDVSHIRQPIIQTVYGNTCYLQSTGDAVLAHLVHVGIVCFQQVKIAMYTKYSHVQEMSR